MQLGLKAGFNVAQAFTAGELGEGHRHELIEAGEGMDPVIAAMALHDAREFAAGEEVEQLGEDDSSGVHRSPLSVPAAARTGRKGTPKSNRFMPEIVLSHDFNYDFWLDGKS